MFKFLVSKLKSISRQSKTSTSEWRRALAYLPFFLVGIGFIGIIGILWSSFVTLVPHTSSCCKYANRRNSHQIVKRSRVQLSPFSLNPTIAPFKYSTRFHRRLPPGNGTCSTIRQARFKRLIWILFWRWINFLVVSPVVGPTSNLILKMSQLLGCFTSCWTHLTWFWQNEVA